MKKREIQTLLLLSFGIEWRFSFFDKRITSWCIMMTFFGLPLPEKFRLKRQFSQHFPKDHLSLPKKKKILNLKFSEEKPNILCAYKLK